MQHIISLDDSFCPDPIDCWQVNRTAAGVIIPDPGKFPSGLSNLISYVKSKGLKFGWCHTVLSTNLTLCESAQGILPEPSTQCQYYHSSVEAPICNSLKQWQHPSKNNTSSLLVLVLHLPKAAKGIPVVSQQLYSFGYLSDRYVAAFLGNLQAHWWTVRRQESLPWASKFAPSCFCVVTGVPGIIGQGILGYVVS